MLARFYQTLGWYWKLYWSFCGCVSWIVFMGHDFTYSCTCSINPQLHLWVPELRLSSILISHFILNLHQANRRLAYPSEATVSLDIQFLTQRQSRYSLPRSLQPFAQPVHIDVEEEGAMDTAAIDVEIDQSLNIHAVSESDISGVSSSSRE